MSTAISQHRQVLNIYSEKVEADMMDAAEGWELKALGPWIKENYLVRVAHTNGPHYTCLKRFLTGRPPQLRSHVSLAVGVTPEFVLPLLSGALPTDATVLEKLFRLSVVGVNKAVQRAVSVEEAERGLGSELSVIVFAATAAVPPPSRCFVSISKLGQTAEGRCKCRGCTSAGGTQQQVQMSDPD